MSSASFKLSIPGMNLEARSEDATKEDVVKKTKFGSEQKIKDDGYKAGRQNEPPTTSLSLDVNENEIFSAFQFSSSRFGEHIDHILHLMRNELGKAVANTKPSPEPLFALTTELQRIKIRNEERLRQLYLDYDEKLRDLRYFQKQNGIFRAPNYSTVTDKTISVALMLILIFVESGINAAFFTEVGGAGLVLGFVIAAGVSIVNVIIPFFCGFFALRNVRSHSHAVRVFSMVAILITAVIIFWFNVGVANYRESGQEQNIPDLANRIVENPFGLEQPQSYLLFFVGVMVALAAFVKGYYFDDAIPGYAGVARRHDAARDAYFSAIAKLKDSLLSASISKEITRLLSDSDKFKRQVLRAKQLINGYNGVINFARERHEMYHTGLVHYLKVYRGANCAVRTHPAPARFEEFPELRPMDLKPLDQETLSKVNDQELHLEVLDKAMHDAEARVQEALGEFQGSGDQYMQENISQLREKMSVYKPIKDFHDSDDRNESDDTGENL